MHTAFIIGQPAIDFTRFLGVAYEALKEKLYTDSLKPTNDVEKFLRCLSQLNEPGKNREQLTYLFSHVAINVLAAYPVDDHDVATICADMSIAARQEGAGVLAVITGTLNEWQVAIEEGVQRQHPLFLTIMHQFAAYDLPTPKKQKQLR